MLFADLVGSTELATAQDPEPLRAMLAAFFDEMREQVQAFGGTVEKYAGDAIMAVFGVPRVSEDDAERAVRAALAMQRSLEQLNPLFENDYGVRLDLRVGVATGEAVASAAAADQFLVTGEVANLAARLQSTATGVVVSEETYGIIGSLLETDVMRDLVLKGFPRPVTAYRVTAIRSAGGRPRGGVRDVALPIVGRDAEMQALRRCIGDLRRGRGQVVTIVGEPGIGKSRLKIEIRETLPEGLRWLEGRCQSFTQSTSYAPLIEVLRSALGITAADPQAIARTKLRAALRQLPGTQADQHQTALAHLLGINLGASGVPALDPRALQAAIIVAMRGVLEGLTQRGAVVLAVEDIHWADAASVDLLTIVMELTDRLPLMLLATCRPETAGEAWTFRFHAERNYPHRLTEVRVVALESSASEELADSLLRVTTVPATLRPQVLERAGGNPLFLEEIVRGLAEQGELHRDGRTSPTGATGWSIPSTLRAVLAARIDALPDEGKRALQRAAVIGRFFTHRALQALSGDHTDELDRALAQLLRADLIRESDRDADRSYMFKHALIQDAAYASILGERRKSLHGTFARHLEAVVGPTGDEHAAVLAHHWLAAEEWEPALHHTLRAAERARALYARPEAVALHWQAIELLARIPSTDARRSTYIDLIVELIDLPGWAGANGERSSEGVRHLADAHRIAAEAGDEARLARVEGLQGFMQRDEGLFLRAIERARRVGHGGAEAFALFWYLIYLGQIGRYAEALGHAGHLIETYGAEGLRFQQALTVTAVGRCWAARAGHMDESLSYARRFREMAEEQRDTRLKAWRVMEAEPYFYLGAWDEALRVTEESLPFAWEIGEHSPLVFGSSWRALAALKVGRVDEARRTLDRALAFATSRPIIVPFPLTYITQVRALLLLAEGQLDEALASARQAIEFAVQSRFRLELGAAHRVLGQVLDAAGDREQAFVALAKSLEIFEEIQSLPELGQTLLACGRFKLGDDAAEARRLIVRARDIFTRIGAAGWVAEADAAMVTMGR